MSNVEVARVILAAMWQIVGMVLYLQRGKDDRARECERKFLGLCEDLGVTVKGEDEE